MTTSHVRQPVARGRKRTTGRPRARPSDDHLMAAQTDVLLQTRACNQPVTDCDSLRQMAAQPNASWHATGDSLPTLSWNTNQQAAAPLLESVAATTARQRWEETVEQRLQQSHQLLQEMHQMMSEQRDNVTAMPQSNGAEFMPQLDDLTQEMASSGQVGGATVPPWPTREGSLPNLGHGIDVGAVIDSLPQQTRDRVRTFTKASVSIHAHVPANVRAKVWSGDFVEMSALLPGVRSSSQNLTLGLQQQGEDGPSIVCVGPKAKPEIRGFPQWEKAFRVYMSLYLSQPIHYHEAPALLKYIDTISDLSERGGNWQTYDDTFRALRMLEGWGWDSTVSELWLRAAQVGNVKSGPAYGGTPFQSKGAIRRPSPNPCFAFNKGQVCDKRMCRYQHKCRRCGASHPVSICTAAPARQANRSKLPAVMPRSNTRQ